MKNPPLILPILGTLLLPGCLFAQTFLSVDFDAGANPSAASPTQSGFFQWNVSGSNVTGPLTKQTTGLGMVYTQTGTLDMTLATGTTLSGTGAFTARDRGTPSTDTGTFTYSALYRDFVNVTGVPNGTSMTLGISGLQPSTSYEMRFFVYDNNASTTRTMTFTDYSSGSAAGTGQISYIGSSTFDGTTSSNVFSVAITAITNASGDLMIRETASSNTAPQLSGFTLSATEIPEPSATSLLSGMAIITLAATRRLTKPRHS